MQHAGWLGENLSHSETYHFTLPASAGPLVYVIGLQALSLSLWAVGFHVQCSAPRTREYGAQSTCVLRFISSLRPCSKTVFPLPFVLEPDRESVLV